MDLNVMIIISLKNIADFSRLYGSNRISNHVFYEIRQEKEIPRGNIYFSFLGSLGSLNVLFQLMVVLPRDVSDVDYILSMKNDMLNEDVEFIEAVVREIYLSIS
ncbi:MAG: hypothetical protein ACTSUE_19910 [Promethearchaeota archaeon]